MGALCAKVVLVVLVFDPYALNVFSQPKALIAVSADALLTALLIAVALREGRLSLPTSPLHAPVLAVAGAYVLATALALDRWIALFGAPDRGLGLLVVLGNVMTYFAVVALTRSRRDLVWLGSTLAGLTVVLFVYALVQRLGLDPVRWFSAGAESRPFATLGNAGPLGLYMSVLAAASVALALARTALIPAVSVILIALLGAWLAGARAAVIGLVFGAAAAAAPYILVFLGRRLGMVAVAGLSFAAAILAGLVALIFLAGGVSILASAPGQIPELLAARGGSITGRVDIYRASAEIVRERPIFGVGPDNFVVAFPRHRAEVEPGVHEGFATQSSTHSWFFKKLTDAGLVGLGSFLASILVAALLAMRHDPWGRASAAGLAAYLGTAAFSIDHVGTAWIPWLAFGLIARSPVVPRETAGVDAVHIAAPRARRRSPARRARDARLFLPTAAILIGLVLAATPIPAIQASHEAREARELYGQADGAREMVSHARAAVELDPHRAEYHNLLGLAQFRLQDYSQAVASFRRAAELAPYEFKYETNLVRALTNVGILGDRAALSEALEIARRVARTHPLVPEAHDAIALAAQANRNYEEAITAGERSVELGGLVEPDVARAMARAYLRFQRPTDAMRWVTAGLQRVPDDVDLRLSSAEVLLDLGQRAEAASVLVPLADAGERASALQQRVATEGVEDLLLAYDFETVPAWRIDGVMEAGTVRRNVLTLGEGAVPWVVRIDATIPPSVRISVLLRFVRAERPALAFDLGRMEASGERVFARLPGWDGEPLQIVVSGRGQERPLSGVLIDLHDGEWYWLELELRGDLATAVVYQAGREPTPKVGSRIIGVLSASIPPDRVAPGAPFLASTLDRPIRLGGTEGDPGGFYMETLR